MSDEIFSVATPFPDVASLAQGYMNRADGERLLLPLPSASRQGTGIRFVVYLSDGTPAFAGAGLCSQISDQGNTVPPEQRFETLLDTLQFDDRSRPVYEYIVAVRSAAYTQQQGAQGDDEPAVDAAIDEPVVEAEESFVSAGDEEATALVSASELAPVPSQPAASWSNAPDAGALAQTVPPESESEPEAYAAVSIPAAAPEPQPSYASMAPQISNEMPSFIPPALPTGLLTRPARTTHWQPSPPRRPTPRPSTGLFRYVSGGLPRPARPPFPELDRSLWVEKAPRPHS
jgi:hypothetical protein